MFKDRQCVALADAQDEQHVGLAAGSESAADDLYFAIPQVHPVLHGVFRDATVWDVRGALAA